MIEIPLSKGKTAFIDDRDAWVLEGPKWMAHKDKNSWYVERSRWVGGNKKYESLHRLILTPGNLQVDHINGNGLDNTRGNLRMCTGAQNSYNRSNRINSVSRFKGVYPDYITKAGEQRWRVAIQINGKRKKVGYCKTEEEAALVYNKAASELFGEFARLNVI